MEINVVTGAAPVYVATQLAVVLNPLPSMYGSRLIAVNLVTAHLHGDDQLGNEQDPVSIAFRPVEAAQMIESLILAAERNGISPQLRSWRDQARASVARFR